MSDLISREEVLSLIDTAYECGAFDGRYAYENVIDAVQNLINPLEIDLVSRQAAIDAFEKFIHELGINDEPYNYGEMALSGQNVPPVTPQPKIGHWIDIDATRSKCDRCGAIFEIASENGEANLCPNCGAKMIESHESDNNVK